MRDENQIIEDADIISEEKITKEEEAPRVLSEEELAEREKEIDEAGLEFFRVSSEAWSILETLYQQGMTLLAATRTPMLLVGRNQEEIKTTLSESALTRLTECYSRATKTIAKSNLTLVQTRRGHHGGYGKPKNAKVAENLYNLSGQYSEALTELQACIEGDLTEIINILKEEIPAWFQDDAEQDKEATE